MSDILSMLSRVQSSQDEELAKEIIRSMLGGAATPQNQPVVAASTYGLSASNSPLPDLGSVEDIRAMLGGGAVPASNEFSGRGDFAPEAGASQLAPVEQAMIEAAEAEQDSRLAAILDAKVMEEQDRAKSLGGAEWVNEAGIAKVKQKDGSTLFTNVKDGSGNYTSDYMGEAPKDFAPNSKQVSQQIQDQLKQVRESSDSATAQVLASNLNSTLTAEYTRMETDAYTMAAAELGVPKLQKALTAQQTLDSMQRAYDPAMGESTETTRLRGQLAQAEQQAKQRAGDWLGRNIGYNQLKATEGEAKIAVDIAVRKAAAQEDRNENKRYDAELKKAGKKEQASAAVASMTPAQRMLAVRTNPDLRVGKEESADSKDVPMVEYVSRSLKNDKSFQQLWEAEPGDYPTLAFAGNKLAANLLLQDESAATGISEQELEQEFQAYSKAPITDRDMTAWAKASIGGSSAKERNEEVARFMSKYNDSKLGANKEASKERAAQEAEMRVWKLRTARQNRITGDVLSWAPAGTPFAEAAKKAKSISGSASMKDTLNQLTQGKSLKEQIEIYTEARASMIQAASKYQTSVFGSLDEASLINNFNSNTLDLAHLAESYREMFASIPLIGGALSSTFESANADLYNAAMR